jgi:thiamine pyrophosphate-dependent acetolactate synthase large subunit-like protein
MAKIMKKHSNRSCDVLIIGGGSAGLRAAIEAHDAGAHVLIISKSRKGDPHTVLARGGINAALGTMDPAYAKYTGKLGACVATSGPGDIHLLNGLYDDKADNTPVIAITGSTYSDLMNSSYQ